MFYIFNIIRKIKINFNFLKEINLFILNIYITYIYLYYLYILLIYIFLFFIYFYLYILIKSYLSLFKFSSIFYYL